ncbi:MAG: hypothetical protein COB36_12455 [Alphaproteobacteria bacterium]|nr:MAG: hypothetical protein COB36_12455 [Alphaproteobacteria bacterium]
MNIPIVFPRPRTTLIGLFIVIALMQIIMALRFEINWDEFYLLALSHELQNGTLNNPLESIFFHAFSWLPLAGENEISQIIAARALMLVCFGLICTFIYKTARRFYGQNASAVAALFYIGFTFIFRSGSNFRVEIMATMVLMCMIWLITDPRQNWRKTILAGFLIGLAGMMTIKAIFYMPIVAVFLLSRWRNSNWARVDFTCGVLMFATALASFAILYVLHETTISNPVNGVEYVASMSGQSFLQDGLFLQAGIFFKAVLQNPIYWLVLALAYIPLRETILVPRTQRAYPVFGLISFLIPLFSILFYRHSYEYYYIFILAPASILIAASVEYFLPKLPRKIPLLIIALLCLQTANVFARSMRQNHNYQDTLLDVIHATYTGPVPYIDYCGMVSSFPRIDHPALFMNKTSLNQRDYFASGRPVMEDILRTHKPKFFIANVPALDLENRFQHVSNNHLLAKDKDVLAAHYVRYWGPLYLPGKTFTLTANAPQSFEIIIDGPYKLMSGTPVTGPVTIDGQELHPHQSISLAQGTHTIASAQNSTTSIVFGSPPQGLKEPPASASLFRGF